MLQNMTVPDGPPRPVPISRPLVQTVRPQQLPAETENMVVDPPENPSAPVSARLKVREDATRRIFRALRRGIRALQGHMTVERRRHTCDQLLKAMGELEVLLLGRRARRRRIH